MRFTPVLVVLFLTFFVADATVAQQLHAVLVADTNAAGPIVPPAVQADLTNMKTTLQPLGARLQVTELTGGDVTPQNITTTLRNLRINQNDAVLFYYSGHGGYDPMLGHDLVLTHGGRLYRSRIERAITRPFTPRFWAMITDCCASISGVAAAPAFAPGNQNTLLKHLFLETTGRVDITAARPEQVSVFQQSGGVFSQSLRAVLEQNAHRRLRWDEVFRLTRIETGQQGEVHVMRLRNGPRFHNGVMQQTQTPYSFKTMFGNEVNGLRLGIYHNRLRITSVDSGSPAWNQGLRPGMRVVAVNGNRVSSDSQLITAVNFSPKNASLDVEHNGGSRRISVQLAY